MSAKGRMAGAIPTPRASTLRVAVVANAKRASVVMALTAPTTTSALTCGFATGTQPALTTRVLTCALVMLAIKATGTTSVWTLMSVHRRPLCAYPR